MHTTIGKAVQPLVIVKRETEERSTMLQEITKKLQLHDQLFKESRVEKLPVTGRIILDAVILHLDPEMENSRLDRVSFFAEKADEFLSHAGVNIHDVVETILQVTTIAGSSVHTIPVKAALEQVNASKEYIQEHSSAAGLTAMAVQTLDKLLSQLILSMENPDSDGMQLDGTFKDWKDKNKDLAEKARQRVEQVLKDKEARQKCEAQTAQEFADCGFTFED